MADIGLTEQLLNVEYYPGYGHPEWQRQNAAQTARGIALTTLPANYVVGHRVPAADPVGEPDSSPGAQMHRRGERQGTGSDIPKSSTEPSLDGAEANIRYSAEHEAPFPMHGAIAAETNDRVGSTEASQTNRRVDTAQTAVTKPVEAAEYERRADVKTAEGKRVAKRVRRQNRKVKRLEVEVDNLPASRRPRQHDFVEMVVATLAAAGCDVPVLLISMTDVPGTLLEHLVLAVLASLGLAIFGGLVGWVCARLWENLPNDQRLGVGAGALAALLMMFVVTVATLAVFRARELALLTSSNFHLADPSFFGPLQALLCAAAALAWFRYSLAETGREMLSRLKLELGRLAALEALRDQLFASAESCRQAAAGAVVDGMKALVTYTELSILEAAEVKSVTSHGKFVSDWFNTVFLHDRFMPQSSDDGLIRFVSGYDERMHAFRRMLSRPLMVLAVLSLCAAGYAIHERAAAVGAVALLVALALAGLGVYVAYLAEKSRLDTRLVTAFLTSAPSQTSGDPSVPTTSNGARDKHDTEEAVRAFVEQGQS